jgi:quinol monooxygenase YgiN
MTDGKLTVVARIKAKPGKEAQVRTELQKLLAPTRAEDSCINYDLHQALESDAEFLFHENWTSKDALDRHLQTPHVQRLLGQADQLLADPVEITFWKQIG